MENRASDERWLAMCWKRLKIGIDQASRLVVKVDEWKGTRMSETGMKTEKRSFIA